MVMVFYSRHIKNPEMAQYYETVHTWQTEGHGERVQMVARLGYANAVGPAPRWPLDTRLKEI